MSTQSHRHHVLITGEYPSLNGGERSLLAALDEPLWSGWRFTFAIPEAGPFADAVLSRGHELIPFRLHDEEGTRLPIEEINASLIEIVSRSDCDLLHANSLSMARHVGRCAKQISIPTTGHLRDIMKLSKAVIRDLNRNHRLIAVSHAVREFHTGQGLNAERLQVIHNGIRTSRPNHSGVDIRSELQLPRDAALLLSIGQIGLRKDFGTSLNVLAEIRKELPDAALLIIGERHSSKAESVEYENALRQRSDHADLKDTVFWLGRRTDVPDIMQAADVLVHPARQEPFGRVLLEAAAHRLPVVSTDVGGTAEMLPHGIASLLAMPGEVHMLARHTLALLQDAGLRERIVEAAAERVENIFTAENSARELQSLWQRTIALEQT